MTFEDYLKILSIETAPSYIENSQINELIYMNYGKFRFNKYCEFIPKPEDNSTSRLLDIGTTPFTFYLQRTLSNYEICSLDRTEHLKDRCLKNRIKLTATNLDDEKLPYEDDYFDVVIFTEVLEHIFAPPSNILKEVNRILRPGGILILSVPNIARLINRIKLLFGKTINEHPDEAMRKSFIHGHGHIHEYEKIELQKILVDCGFIISHFEFLQRGIIDAAKKHLSKNEIKAVASMAYHIVTKLIPTFRENILFVCKKSYHN